MIRTLAALALVLAAIPAAGQAPGAAAGGASAAVVPRVVLAARSIGSRRPDPPDRKAHAALLIRLGAGPAGFIVQGGKESVPGWLPGRARVVGYVIPTPDPALDFTRATGAWWGEPEARVLPTRELAAFDEPGLTEARIRAIVDALNEEFRTRDYRLDGGPSSNSFVSRFLERLGRPLPGIGDAELPGWGWRP